MRSLSTSKHALLAGLTKAAEASTAWNVEGTPPSSVGIQDIADTNTTDFDVYRHTRDKLRMLQDQVKSPNPKALVKRAASNDLDTFGKKLKPGDIILTKGKDGPSTFLDRVVTKLQKNPWEHAGMYLGDGKVLHMATSLSGDNFGELMSRKRRVHSLKRLDRVGRDMLAVRPNIPKPEIDKAVGRAKKMRIKGYSFLDMLRAGLLPAKRLAKEPMPEKMICTAIPAFAYRDVKFSDRARRHTLPADFVKSKKTTTVARYIHEKTAGIGTRVAGGAIGAGAFLALNPGIRKSLLHNVFNITDVYGKKDPPPPQSMANAERLTRYLEHQGIDPKKAKIAIVGSGGSGKSSLAKALSQHIGIRWAQLDEKVNRLPSSVLPGTVSEQTHLLNRVDPDRFDVIVKVERSPEKIDKSLLKRERGAWQRDLYNIKKLTRSISEGFNATKGKTFTMGNSIEVKVKPEGGFKSNTILNRKLRKAGISPKGLDRESKVVSLVEGRRNEAGGVGAYIKTTPFLQAATLVGLGTVLAPVLKDALKG